MFIVLLFSVAFAGSFGPVYDAVPVAPASAPVEVAEPPEPFCFVESSGLLDGEHVIELVEAPPLMPVPNTREAGVSVTVEARAAAAVEAFSREG